MTSRGFLPRLAWRMAWGRPLRTSLGVSSVAAGTAVVAMVLAVLAGLEHYLLARATGTLLGDVVCTASVEPGERPLGAVFDPAPIQTLAERHAAGIVAAASRLVVPALVTAGDRERSGFIYGIDPHGESIVSSDLGGLEALAAPGEGAAVLLSPVLAEALSVRTGDTLELVSTDRFGLPRGTRARVAGLFTSSSRGVEAFVMLTTLEVAGGLLDARGLVHEVALRLGEGDAALDRLPAVVDALGRDLAAYPDLHLHPWTLIAPAIVDFLRINASVYDLFLAAISLVVALAVADVLLLGLYERIREIGTVGALGARPRSVAALMAWQGAAIVTIGMLIGFAVGEAAVAYFQHHAIPGLGGDAGFSVGGVLVGEGLRARFQFKQVLLTLTVVVAAGALAVMVPARKARRLEPVEALRHR